MQTARATKPRVFNSTVLKYIKTQIKKKINSRHVNLHETKSEENYLAWFPPSPISGHWSSPKRDGGINAGSFFRTKAVNRDQSKFDAN